MTIKCFKQNGTVEFTYTKDSKGNILDRYIKEDNVRFNEGLCLNRLLDFLDSMVNANKNILLNTSEIITRTEARIEAYTNMREKLLEECEVEDE